MSTVTLMQSFTVTTCASCGIAFAAPEDFLQKRREDKRSFYCPNGHSLSYTRSVEDKLRDELATEHKGAALLPAENQQKALPPGKDVIQ